MDITSQLFGLRRLRELGFSDEAITNALSKQAYRSAEEAIAAVREEQAKIDERLLGGLGDDAKP